MNWRLCSWRIVWYGGRSTTELNYGEIVAKTLAMYDVKHIFFVSGDVHELFVGLEDAGVRMILTRSEKAAAYMADGYARISFRPSVCYAQQGPAAANLAAGLVEPYFASSPVIAITTGYPAHLLAKNVYQAVDQMQLFQAMTKWNMLLTSLKAVPTMLRQAFCEATTGNPGPVHIEAPMDIAKSKSEVQLFVDKTFSKYPAVRCVPDHTGIQEAAKLLASSERPVIVAGHGTMMSQAWNELQELATLLSIPVSTTLSGKGVIPEDHPLSIGVVGDYGRKSANEIVSESDLVFFVGCRTGGMATNSWTVPKPGTKVIHLDIKADELGRNYPAEVVLMGDAKLGLQELIAVLGRISNRSKGTRIEQIQTIVREWKRIRDSEMSSDYVPIKPPRVIKEIRNQLRPEDIVVADTGYMGAWTGAYYDILTSGRTYIRSAGSLGWAFPAAMGAWLAASGRRVVCVTGDGGIGYHLTELETALRCNIPIVTVILNNRSLAVEYHIYKYFYGGKAYASCDFYDVDYGKVASAYGGYGIRVERPGDIGDALKNAFESGKPSIVDVLVDKESMGPISYYEDRWKEMGSPPALRKLERRI
jgi:acetolactate synthase I/II/III large subunit